MTNNIFFMLLYQGQFSSDHKVKVRHVKWKLATFNSHLIILLNKAEKKVR